jgi:predicted RNA-binding protein Jag
VSEPEAGSPVETADRAALAASVLSELLRLADVPATLDVRPSQDGGISIAMLLGCEVPGVAAGRRGTFVDALQFLVNKLTHRPGSERRWVSLGVGDHPAPRPARGPKPGAESNGGPRSSAGAPRTSPAGPAKPAPEPAPAPEARPAPPEESTLEVPEDAELSAAARALGEASARTGRYYGVVALSVEDRSRMLRAVAGVAGVRASSEGEGRFRRLVLTPERPTPMPRRVHPADDLDDEETGAEGADR